MVLWWWRGDGGNGPLLVGTANGNSLHAWRLDLAEKGWWRLGVDRNGGWYWWETRLALVGDKVRVEGNIIYPTTFESFFHDATFGPSPPLFFQSES